VDARSAEQAAQLVEHRAWLRTLHSTRLATASSISPAATAPVRGALAHAHRDRRLDATCCARKATDTRNAVQPDMRLCPTACPTGTEFPMAKPNLAGIIIRGLRTGRILKLPTGVDVVASPSDRSHDNPSRGNDICGCL
jgi:hypothetical protein